MKRQLFCKWIVIVVCFAACSREQTARDVGPGFSPAATDARLKPGATSSAPLHTISYADAMTWLKTTKGFHFVLEEQGVRAEGDMERPRIGMEKVRFTTNGEEWTAATGASGIEWRRAGVAADPPPNGGRVFQRVTIAFDPQKVEGEAKLVEPGHYLFTNANTGEVHSVFVKGDHVSRITIGGAMSLTITP